MEIIFVNEWISFFESMLNLKYLSVFFIKTLLSVFSISFSCENKFPAKAKSNIVIISFIEWFIILFRVSGFGF